MQFKFMEAAGGYDFNPIPILKIQISLEIIPIYMFTCADSAIRAKSISISLNPVSIIPLSSLTGYMDVPASFQIKL